MPYAAPPLHESALRGPVAAEMCRSVERGHEQSVKSEEPSVMSDLEDRASCREVVVST